MSYYNISLLQPENFPNTLAMHDVGLLLQYAFESLGLPAAFRMNAFDPSATNIILGYQVMPDPSTMAGHDCIIFQMEQLHEEDGSCTPQMLELLRAARIVLDYSPENVEFLRGKGIKDVRLLPLGYHERLRVIPSNIPPEIDVLFYGLASERRNKILHELKPHCRVRGLFGVYGHDRDVFIARSKVVLNIHHYRAHIMEQARVSYLINNARCVVSEDSSYNLYSGMIAAVPYEQLAETCLRLVRNDAERNQLVQRGVALFQQRPMTEYLRNVLGNEP